MIRAGRIPGSLSIHLPSRRRREASADRRCLADGRSGESQGRAPPVSLLRQHRLGR